MAQPQQELVVVAVAGIQQEVQVDLVAVVTGVQTLAAFQQVQELQTQVAVAVVGLLQHRVQVAQVSSSFVILERKKAQAVRLLAQVVTQSTPSHHLAHTQHKDKTWHILQK
jgi:hypothetical protein